MTISEHPLLKITIDPQPGGVQVRLSFDDPASGVAPNAVPGALALPVQTPDAVAKSGNMDTVYLEPLGVERVAQHAQTVDLALTSTQLLLRKLEIICQGAVLLTESSSLSALADGKILALPAAWQFVDSVLEEGTGPG